MAMVENSSDFAHFQLSVYIAVHSCNHQAKYCEMCGILLLHEKVFCIQV